MSMQECGSDRFQSSDNLNKGVNQMVLHELSSEPFVYHYMYQDSHGVEPVLEEMIK